MSEANIYHPEYVRNLFNEMASSYDRVNYITSFGFSLRWRKQFIRKINADRNSIKILDLMTGLGETWHILQRQFPNSEIDALDYSDAMVEKTRQKASHLSRHTINILHDNALESKLKNSYYDGITCAFGLKTFDKEQLEILSQEVNRILKPGGFISFIEISIPENKILRTLYGFYTGKIIPLIGKIMLGNPRNYRMLWKYTIRFKNCDYVADVFQKNGFEIQKESYFFGCSTGFSGTKK